MRLIVFMVVLLESSVAFGIDAIEEWVQANQESIRDMLLPYPKEISPRDKNAPWWTVSARVYPEWDAPEWQFTLSEYADDHIKVKVMRLQGQELYKQLLQLRSQYPQSSIAEIAKRVKLSILCVSDSELPMLRSFAKEFEKLKISPLPSNFLTLHGSYYYFMVHVYWGTIPSQLTVFEPAGSYWGNPGEYPHPLVKWLKAVMKSSEAHFQDCT